MNKSKLTTNVIFQTAYQIVSLIVPFITAPYISRIFNARLIGEQSYSVTVSNYFVMFAMLGIANLGARNIAKVKQDKKMIDYEFSRLFYCHLLISVFALLCYLIFLFVYKTDFKFLFVIGLIYVLNSVLDINWLFFGLEEFKITVTRNLVIKIISIISIFIFVKTSDDLWKYSLILALSNLISNVYLWLVLPRFVKFEKVSFHDVYGEIKPLLILFIPVIAVSIYRQMDKIMLAVLASTEQLGYYEQAEKIVNLGTQVMTSVGVVMMPRFTELYTRGEYEEAKKIINISNLVSGSFSCAISFGLISISDALAYVYLGEYYIPCGTLICMLAPVVMIMSYANIVRTHYLIPKAKDKPYVISAIIGACVNLVFNFICIPLFGAKGAILGTLLAEIVVGVIQCVYSRKDLPLIKMLLDYFPFIIIGVFMSTCLRKLYDCYGYSIQTLLAGVALGVVIYVCFSAMYVFIFKKNTMDILIKSLKNK